MPEISFSTAARNLQAKVEDTIAHGGEISYNFEFLERYRPNLSFYLDEQTRAVLRAAGSVRTRPCGFAEKFILDLSHHSSRLEGNKLSMIQTKELFRRIQTAHYRVAEEELMLLNHREAIKFLLESAPLMGLTTHLIYGIHSHLATGLIGDPKDVGRLRKREVVIGDTPYVPLKIPQKVEECFNKIVQKAQQIMNPFEQSFFLMVHLPYLQPFIDVNKRTSRLAANIPLITNRLCPFTFVDVNTDEYTAGFLGVYLENNVTLLREIYKWGYLRSCDMYKSIQIGTRSV